MQLRPGCLCRELFAELQEGPRASADLSAFTSCLNINHAIQQASHLPSTILGSCRSQASLLCRTLVLVYVWYRHGKARHRHALSQVITL